MIQPTRTSLHQTIRPLHQNPYRNEYCRLNGLTFFRIIQ